MSRELERMRKQSAQKVENAKQILHTNSEQLTSRLSLVIDEEQRVTTLSRNAPTIIENLDKDFEKRTRLNGTDVAFLFLAVALQCVRQYVLTLAPERPGDKEAAGKVKDKAEHSDRSHRLYNPSLEEIISNPVPFDAAMGAKQYHALEGFGALGHRGATPGHDPILGLFFGTANIATSTLTNWRMESYHISTGVIGNARGPQDIFSKRADTSLVVSYTIDKLLYQGMEGKIIVGVSMAKEIQHLRSDISSKDSLPLPVISAFDPVMAGELAKRGLDMANVMNAGKQFVYAVAIDTLIALIHGFFYNEAVDGPRNLYEVRTRRILLYSNLIASASNVVVSAVSAYLGADSSKIIDWGGFLNTLRNIVFDTKFIQEVKRDFLKNEIYKMVVGDQYDFMEGV